ncbi:hypothetical protein L1987_32437 [Smallanthus sonchifolius]|uniref:Uncharacterized protein n=1 Tax=Smallanthus sonchifolius TaxID=185202 RepID=A0ACB9HMK8_9ASTR|nr:hypothetical protein L1987_32437 [Smallanthus sonchifolius]
MWGCNRIKYLFSPLMAKFLSNLEKINIAYCDGLEEVVSNRDDEAGDVEMTTSTTHPTTNFFPHLERVSLICLKNLKRIGGGATSTVFHQQFKSSHVRVVPWSLCQYSREMIISECESLMEVFESQGINYNNGGGGCITSTSMFFSGTDNTSLVIPRVENINVPQWFNLKKLEVESCNLLKYVFTFSTIESLKQLEDLVIWQCKAMGVIVRKEVEEERKVVKFPRLKSLYLSDLPNLKGFFLGINEFQWPLLEKVTFSKCLQMMVFTPGRSTTPKLKYIHTSLGKHSLECCHNFHVTTLHQTRLTSSGSTSLERLPWSFHNLIEMDMAGNHDWKVKCIIPSNELLQLQKLERMRVEECWSVEEVFEVEAMEGTTQTLVQIPNLAQLELKNLSSLKYIWKSNHHQRTLLEFPNLTTLSIHDCKKLKHVFTSSMVGSLKQLQDLHICSCNQLEVIVKEEEKEEERSEVFEVEAMEGITQIVVQIPNLTHLKLWSLSSLKYIWKSNHHQRTIVLKLPNLRTLAIDSCFNLNHVFISSMVGSLLQLQDLRISRCNQLEIIVKKEEEEESASELSLKGTKSGLQNVIEIPNLTLLELEFLKNLKYIWKSSHHGTILLFPNLITLSVVGCDTLKHVFTISMVSSLQKLQKLRISWCENMEVIVKEHEDEEESECDAKVKEIATLPCLKSLELTELQRLKAFCLGKDDFSCPSLHTLKIMECPEIKAFTKGHVDTPALNGFQF